MPVSNLFIYPMAPSACIDLVHGEPNGKEETPLRSSVLHRSLGERPPVIVGSQDHFLYSSDGREILDATGGAAVACVGHNNPHVKAAIIKQLNSVSYCYPQFFTTPPAEKLSKLLTDSTGGRMSRVFIVSSGMITTELLNGAHADLKVGSEAVEAALKMARQYFVELPEPQPQRVNFIARRQSYHGNTLGALAVGSHVARKSIYRDMLSTNISHVSPCYSYREMMESETEGEYVRRLAEELDNEFQRVGSDTVCAFIAETVSGGVSTVP